MKTCLLLLALSAVSSAQATLWVVDDDGGAGVDFTDLQLAIDTASENDAILVRRGEYYGNYVIDGKSLLIVADPGARLYAPGSLLLLDSVAVDVRNLAPTQVVTLLGTQLHAIKPLEITGGVWAQNDAGVVWLEDVTVTTTYAVRAEQSGQVVLAACTGTLLGNGADIDRPPASILEDATAAFFDTCLEAATGLGGCGVGLDCGGAKGGAATSLSGTSALFASGGELVAGAGEPGGSSAACGPFLSGKGGDGGDGIEVDASSTVTLLDNPFTAGLGGLAEIGSACPDGDDGEAVVGDGTVTQLSGVARSLTCTTPVREAEPVELTFRGEPDDLVFGFAAATPFLLEIPGFVGPFAVKAPVLTVPIGTLPASGELTFDLVAGELPLGVDFFVRYLQALHVTPALDFYLSTPTALVVLDDAF